MSDVGVAIKNIFGTGKDIYWYGIIIAVALIVAIVLGVKEAKRRGYISDLVIDYMFIAVPLAIVCARLYYVAFEWEHFAKNPISILYIWNGGLAILGAVIGGIIAAIIFCKWKKVPFGDLMDIAAPCLILAQAIGRWGNFANQEAYGPIITDANWAWFPAAVYIERLQEWHMATFFYESVWNLIVFVILMFYRKKAKFRGNVFAAYLMLYGLGRAVIEGLRTDSLYLIQWATAKSVNEAIVFNGLRISQVLSLLMVIGAIIYFIVMRKKNPVQEAYFGKYSIGFKEESEGGDEDDIDEKEAVIAATRAAEVKPPEKPEDGKEQPMAEDKIAQDGAEAPEETEKEEEPEAAKEAEKPEKATKKPKKED